MPLLFVDCFFILWLGFVFSVRVVWVFVVGSFTACCWCCCYCCCAIVKRTQCPLIIYFCGYSPTPARLLLLLFLLQLLLLFLYVVVVVAAVVSATNQSNVVPASRNGWSFVFFTIVSRLSSHFFCLFCSVLWSLYAVFCCRFDFMLLLDLLSLGFCFAARSKISINVFFFRSPLLTTLCVCECVCAG